MASLSETLSSEEVKLLIEKMKETNVMDQWRRSIEMMTEVERRRSAFEWPSAGVDRRIEEMNDRLADVSKKYTSTIAQTTKSSETLSDAFRRIGDGFTRSQIEEMLSGRPSSELGDSYDAGTSVAAEPEPVREAHSLEGSW